MKEIECRKQKEAKTRENLDALAIQLNKLSLKFELKAGEEGKLFGSVTTQMISSELNEKGFSVDKKYISLDESIKSLGNHFAIVDFGDSIEARIKIKVVAEKE